MALLKSDEELFAMVRGKLFSAVIGDILDEMHLLHQFLPPEIRPLRDDMVVVGRAMTVMEQDILEEDKNAPAFGLMFEALDDLKPSEVYVASGGSPSYAMWGELMSTRAMRLGAAGAVVNGQSRDTNGILHLGFATFSLGRYAQDQRPRGRVTDFRCPLTIGQVNIQPGDLIMGDVDGVLVIPRAAEEEALARAIEKVEKENLVRIAIERDGIPSAEAFRRFGVM
ncbi:MAG TPA: RraA family protein [Bryobacteraceae bacterium]|nr:RraA family protein [Bryobacteraceae bacterium]